MKAIPLMESNRGKEYSTILMELSTKDHGVIILEMGMDSYFGLIKWFIMVVGRTISNTEKDKFVI